MPTRLLLSLLLLIAAPLLLLGWVSASRMRDDRAEAERQIRVVLQERLVEIDASVAEVFQETSRRLSRAVSQATQASVPLKEALTRIRHKDSMCRQFVIVNNKGFLVFPSLPDGASPSRLEEHGALVALSASRPRADSDAVDKKPASKGKSASLADPVFHVWYRDEGTQLSLWWTRSDGSAIGCLLERANWIAEVTGRLPDSQAVADEPRRSYATQWGKSLLSEPRTESGITSLVDQSGELIYRWGFSGDLSKEADVELPLSPPLSSWRLQYTSRLPLVQPVRLTSLILSLGGLGVALVALGSYVLTGLQRQMRLARQRVTFAGQVSHELRTPLTNLRLYAELAQADLAKLPETDDGKLASRLKVIDHESRRLSRLVSGVMEIIREDTPARPIRRQRLDVDAAIEEILDSFGDTFQTRGILVEKDLMAAEPVRIDRDCLEMILVNLLSNVEKYACEGGWVRLTSSLDGQWLTLRVSDRGPGIPHRQRKNIFKAFSRVDDSISAASGTGIGLTIARRAARRHGGDVKLIPQKQGACFEATLQIEREIACG